MMDIKFFRWLVKLPKRFVKCILKLHRDMVEYILGIVILLGSPAVLVHSKGNVVVWISVLVFGTLLMLHGIYLGEREGR